MSASAGNRVALAVLALSALVGFGMVPSIQLRVVGLAGPGGDLAASLSASAVNAGIAAGSLAGGWALATHGVSAVVLVGAGLCLLALPATWATRRLMPPRDGWATAEPATALTPDAPVP
jgi:DHA1 family inner membrane transport protein